MLILLPSILMMSFPVFADEELENLIPIQPGYFLSDMLAEKIIDKYPELKQIFDNAIRVEPGYYMTEGVTIDLANYIQDINDENARLKTLAESLNNALQREREMVQLVIQGKDEEIRIRDDIIELQNELIKEYRNIHGKNEVLEKVSQAAGIAAFLYIISTL